MKPISFHVSEKAYQELKSVAAQRGRPVAELIRQAMDEFLRRELRSGPSVLDLEPLECGEMLEGWTRSELFDEMVSR